MKDKSRILGLLDTLHFAIYLQGKLQYHDDKNRMTY